MESTQFFGVLVDQETKGVHSINKTVFKIGSDKNTCDLVLTGSSDKPVYIILAKGAK
jgi:hypothetical protein